VKEKESTMTLLKATLKKLAQGKCGVRPLQAHSAEEILQLCDLASGEPHLRYDVLFQAWVELVDVRRSRKPVRNLLEQRFALAGTRPAPWIGVAMRAVQAVSRSTTGKHHVYVLVKIGFDEDGKGMGLYVGETWLRPAGRFVQHASGLSEQGAARDFRLDRVGGRRVPLGLLPSFHAHLNPLSREEAKQLEVALVQALLAAKVPAARVGGPRILKANPAQQEHDDPDAS
jgi:hypothetical protein